MFWRTQLYDIPLPAPSFQEELREFAENNHFTMSGSEQAGKLVLCTPETPGKHNACCIHVEFIDQHSKRFFKVQVKPNNWLLGLMTVIVVAGAASFIKPSEVGFLGYSIPFIILIPYMYALYAQRLLMDVKGILLPGYLQTAEGKKEVFKGYMSPLGLFLKGQMVLYIGFVVLFISGMILWMLGAFDSDGVFQLIVRKVKDYVR